jgi:hypothetical protein
MSKSIVAPETELTDLLAVFQYWLHHEDTGAIEVALGAYAANRLPGDPVWLMLVGPPSGGKGEILNSLVNLPSVHTAGTLTESALLSGVGKKHRAHDAQGGLLKEMGEFGILLLKDFTSALSMPRETRACMLAALREIYDGAWTRRLGVDGGRRLHWSGKMGLIAGVTEALDSHHGVMADMGPRFVLYRLPSIDAEEQARRALAYSGYEETMREQLRVVVRDFFDELNDALGSAAPQVLDEQETAWLVPLAVFATRCRSAVERHPHTREILLVPQPEAPARLTRCAAQLLAGLAVIRVQPQRRCVLVRKCLLDCIPPVRRRAIDYLAHARDEAATSEIARHVGLPEQTLRAALEDLACHGVVAQGSDRKKTWKIPSEWDGHVKVAYEDL